MKRIVGIALVRDEDLYVERALRNVFGFCDELILADHRSRDGTPEILRRVAATSPIPTQVHRLRDPADSHALVQDYVGEAVWAFGVDGDEIYDPSGLRRFREHLLGGELDEWWSIKGIQLHCRRLDLAAQVAEGWLAPPARSTTKLFNLAAAASWNGKARERLHGDPVLRPGYRREAYMLRDEEPWDSAAFRCLHVCFFPRSSGQRRGRLRTSIAEREAGPPRERLVRRLRTLGGAQDPHWKLSRYTQGELVRRSVAGFFEPDDAERLGSVIEAPSSLSSG